jgi:hypothetical protein
MIKDKQQTAVEWFVEQLRKNENIRWRGTPFFELSEQAKEMEKQRMFDFAKSFVYTWNYITNGNFESTKDMNKELENLFEETYGGVNK